MNVNHDSLQPHPRRVVNLKAVAISTIVIGLLYSGMQRLHTQQVVKTTAYLKQAADAAVEQGDPQEAIQSLERYLKFSRGDVSARRKLSELLSLHAADEEALRVAYAMNEALLLDDKNNSELKLRQTTLAVRLKLFSDADSHLKVLRNSLRDEPQVWHLSGVTAEHRGNDREAIDYYKQAIECGSQDADTCARLAQLLSGQGDNTAEIEAIFNDLITRHESGDAFGALADWLLTQDRSDEAISRLWSGLALSPADVRLNGMLAAALRQDAKSNPARQEGLLRLITHLQFQINTYPAGTHLRLICARVQWDADRRDDAVATLKVGILKNPQAFELQETLIDYLVSNGNAADARQAFERLPRNSVDHARWHFLEGRVLMADRRWAEAERSFEKASGFSGADESIRHQSGMCSAVCRREQGEREGAIDAWRNSLQADPTSSDSRLGMAAAWLDSGRTDLAIAEYRQLLHVRGVPELLTSLLIRDTLQQQISRQNWKELEHLLNDNEPVITDESQRLLLKADLLFARGYPARALRSLDTAAPRQPTNSLLHTARRRLLADDQGALMNHLEETLKRRPDDLESHVAILRLRSSRDGHESSEAWLTQLLAGKTCGQLSERQRLVLSARIAETAAADFDRTNESASAATMLTNAEVAWNRLIDDSPDLRAQAIAFIARHRDNNVVVAKLTQLPQDTTSILETQCWLAALENARQKEELRETAERAIRRLVTAEPANMGLRQAYIEYLIQFAEYDSALAIERQILQREPNNAAALSRCAWILMMVGGDHSEALSLSEAASRHTPADPAVRIIRALVLAGSSDPGEALPVFGSIPAEARTPESLIYEALALLRSGRRQDALRIADQVERQYALRRWRPADRKLLKQILQQATATPGVASN